jgi:hypothetical protein
MGRKQKCGAHLLCHPPISEEGWNINSEVALDSNEHYLETVSNSDNSVSDLKADEYLLKSKALVVGWEP